MQVFLDPLEQFLGKGQNNFQGKIAIIYFDFFEIISNLKYFISRPRSHQSDLQQGCPSQQLFLVQPLGILWSGGNHWVLVLFLTFAPLSYMISTLNIMITEHTLVTHTHW